MNKNFIASLIVVVSGLCVIAMIHYASFERHHIHNASGAESTVSLDIQGLEALNHKSQIILAISAVLGLVIAVAGLFLIAKTLVETKNATKAASDTLIEARKATQAAVETLTSDRAWVFLGDGRVNFAENSWYNEPGIQTRHFQHGIIYQVGITNAGRSPALQTEIFHTDWKGIGEFPPNLIETRPRTLERPMVIASGQLFHTNDKAILDDELNRWARKELRWLIYVQITYKTIFGDSVFGTKLLLELGSTANTFANMKTNPIGVFVEPLMQETFVFIADETAQ